MRSSDEGRFDKLLVFLATHFMLDSSEFLNLRSDNDLFYSIDAENNEIVSAIRRYSEDNYVIDDNLIGKQCYSILCGRPEPCGKCKDLCGKRVHRRTWIEKSEITGGTYLVHGKSKIQDGKTIVQFSTNQIRSLKDAWEAQEKDAESKDFLTDVLGILSDTKSKNPTDRFRKMLDYGTEFFDCDGIFLFLFGTKTKVFTDAESARMNNHLMEDEISTMTYKKIKKIISEDAVCLLENAENAREIDPEMYELLKIWSVDNALLIPLFLRGMFIGMLLLRNIRRNLQQASVLSSISTVVAEIQREHDMLEKKQIDELKRRSKNDALVKEVLSSSYALLLHIDLKKGTYKAFLHDDELINSLIPKSGLLGQAKERLLGMVDRDYMNEIREFCNLATLKNRLNRQKAIYADYRTVTRRWARGSILPVNMDKNGDFDQIIFGLQIIDEEKRRALEKDAKLAYALEEVRDANEAKTFFFRHLSHDIRTPMNAIFGLTRRAQANMDNPDVLEDSLNKILSSSDHLLALINDSLDISKIESGKVVLSHERVILADSVKLYESITHGYLVDRKLDLSWEVMPLPCEGVMTDETHLKRIILNLLSNAIKYTPDGGRISFRLENSPGCDDNHIKLKYIISDNGVGMSENFLKRIYEPFSQAEKMAVNSNYAGTGLGMSIVKKYVDFLGGKISITSKEKVGTHIEVEFEFEKALPRTEEELTKAPESENDISGKKVLLAEDNDINREIAREQLKEMGLIVTEAINGKQAVEIINASGAYEYDGVLMDIMMPVMDGYAATKKIRRLKRPDAKSLPIIALTANAFDEDVKRSLSCGMNDHLAKPVDPEALLRLLRRYL